MSEQGREARLFVEDILQNCRYILDFTSDCSERHFLGNVMIQMSVIRALEILGEASKQLMALYPDAVTLLPALPLRRMYATRNKLIHGYISIDMTLVWRIITDQVPSVHRAAQTILANWPADLD